MKTIDFFSTTSKMRGYAGDTFPVFRVVVTGMELDGCSMRIVLERKDTPGSVAFTKACSHFTAQEESGFIVQLDSQDTANLSGVYTMHFIMTGSDELEYRKLIGTLEVFDMPREVTS